MTSTEDFVACVESHKPAWIKIACSFMNFEDAEDVVQDTMFRGWRGLEAFNGDSGLHTWMHRILLNVIRDRRRRELRRGGANGHDSIDEEFSEHRERFDHPSARDRNVRPQLTVPETVTRQVLYGEVANLIRKNCTVIQQTAIFSLGNGPNVLKVRLARYHGIARLRKVLDRKVA